jgi:hypothetical protein
MEKNNKIVDVLQRLIQNLNNKEDLNEWYRSLAEQYADIIAQENPTIPKEELKEEAKKRARSHIKQRLDSSVKVKNIAVLLYGDSAKQRLEYVQTGVELFIKASNDDLVLIHIDLSTVSDEQFNDKCDLIQRDSEMKSKDVLLFLDNLDKTSLDVYESARLLLKGMGKPENWVCVAGLSNNDTSDDYLDDSLITSCLHIVV